MRAFVPVPILPSLSLRPVTSLTPRRRPRMCSTSPRVPDAVVGVAAAAADAARAVTLKYYRSPALRVEFKADESPVTAADREAERAMRRVILDALPDHAVLGEEDGGRFGEHGENGERPDFTWVLDPIDGTKSFVCGKPTFGTLIAVLDRDGVPVYGVVDQSVSGERWEGGVGRPTTLNGEVVRVRDVYDVESSASVNNAAGGGLLGKCVAFATHPDMFMGADAPAFRELSREVKHVMYGCDCYAYALLATGCADLVVEADLKVWDFAALVPVVTAAGGVMTDWHGHRLDVCSDGRVVAAADVGIHAEALQSLQRGLVDGDGRESERAKGGMEEETLAVNTMGSQVSSRNSQPGDPGEGHVESMTGFGEAEEPGDGDLSVLVQLRSVNSRYCDVQYRGPRMLAPYEAELTASIKKALGRGKVIFTVSINSALDVASGELVAGDDAVQGGESPSASAGSSPSSSAVSSPSAEASRKFTGTNGGNGRSSKGRLSLELDTNAVVAARSMLDRVAATAGIESNPSISDILTFSDIFVKADTSDSAEELVPVVRRALGVALQRLVSARRREGALLERDLISRCLEIERVLDEVAERAPQRIQREQERLKGRLAIVRAGVDAGDLVEGRLEQELALIADRIDITEEIVRLRSHVMLFKLTFSGVSEPIGQKLTFMLQEMHREATTIASKSNDAAMAQLAVLIKQEIEKIREQVMNIC